MIDTNKQEMEFRTIVDIERPSFRIEPCEEVLFVGSCFADSIGRRFTEERFRTTINPYGVMYNPASILHTIERISLAPRVAVLTLGTNRVSRLKATGEFVYNCHKRPQSLFDEQSLSIDECVGYLAECVRLLQQRNSDVRVVVTVSPIRYRKYGYHGSRLSKATLLLATDRLAGMFPDLVSYFPAYEILNDELRDYRFYQPDMIHPSEQAVEYIWQRFSEVYLSDQAKIFIEEWRPLKEALAHKPFNPDGQEYKDFMAKTNEKIEQLSKKYANFVKP